jgi:hypothetical protein
VIATLERPRVTQWRIRPAADGKTEVLRDGEVVLSTDDPAYAGDYMREQEARP